MIWPYFKQGKHIIFDNIRYKKQDRSNIKKISKDIAFLEESLLIFTIVKQYDRQYLTKQNPHQL